MKTLSSNRTHFYKQLRLGFLLISLLFSTMMSFGMISQINAGMDTKNRSNIPSIQPQSATEIAKWTFMVYLDADNNLEAAGIDDLNELETVGSDDSVNFVALMDRVEAYDETNGDWTDARHIYIEKDDNQYSIQSSADSIGEVNMGDPNTLENFIDWSQTNYPAENYALVLWDHGSGVMSGGYQGGICYDDTSYYDALTAQEIDSVLEGKGITLLGMDACLMAAADFQYEFYDSVDVIVASEKTEPGDGWPYNTIAAWLTSHPEATAAELGEIIVEKYTDSYPTYYNIPVTQSAIDSSKLFALQESTSEFAEILQYLINTNHSLIVEARLECYEYDDEPFIDLYQFAEEITEVFPDNTSQIYKAAQWVMENVTATVIANDFQQSSMENSHGLTVYFPHERTDYSSHYSFYEWAISGLWDEFLQSYYSGTSENVSGEDLFEENDNYWDSYRLSTGFYPSLIWNDDDWYRIELEENDSVQITMNYDHITDLYNLDFYLYENITGTLIDSSFEYTGIESVSYVSNQSITLYLYVDNYNSEVVPIEYSLQVDILGEDDLYDLGVGNDVFDQAIPLLPAINASTFYSNLTSYDPDWYFFDTPPSNDYLITIWLEYDYFEGALSMSIYGKLNEENFPRIIASIGSAGNDELYSFSPFVEHATDNDNDFIDFYDSFYVEVINYENNEHYNLSISIEGDIDDQFDINGTSNDLVEEAVTLVDGTYGNLTCIDPDIYQIWLDEGDWIHGELSFLNDLGDLDLYLFNENNTDLSYSYYTDDYEQVIYQSNASGYFYLEVYPYEVNLNYTLSINTNTTFSGDIYEGVNNFPFEASNYPEIQLGTSMYNLSAFADDYYQVALSAGESYIFYMDYESNETTLYVELFNSNWDRIEYSYTPDSEEMLEYTALSSGVYYLRIRVLRPIETYKLICYQVPDLAYFYGITDLTLYIEEDFTLTNFAYDVCEWDMGDGTIYTGPLDEFSHIYAEPGTYSVTISFSGEDGKIHSFTHEFTLPEEEPTDDDTTDDDVTDDTTDDDSPDDDSTDDTTDPNFLDSIPGYPMNIFLIGFGLTIIVIMVRKKKK